MSVGSINKIKFINIKPFAAPNMHPRTLSISPKPDHWTAFEISFNNILPEMKINKNNIIITMDEKISLLIPKLGNWSIKILWRKIEQKYVNTHSSKDKSSLTNPLKKEKNENSTNGRMRRISAKFKLKSYNCIILIFVQLGN